MLGGCGTDVKRCLTVCAREMGDFFSLLDTADSENYLGIVNIKQKIPMRTRRIITLKAPIAVSIIPLLHVMSKWLVAVAA